MSIPDEAIEAAAKINFEYSVPHDWEDEPAAIRVAYRAIARKQLEAAAPLIRAQALNDYADEWAAFISTPRRNPQEGT